MTMQYALLPYIQDLAMFPFLSDCANILLMHGASIMLKNVSGWTPLAEAVSFGDRQLSK